MSAESSNQNQDSDISPTANAGGEDVERRLAEGVVSSKGVFGDIAMTGEHDIIAFYKKLAHTNTDATGGPIPEYGQITGNTKVPKEMSRPLPPKNEQKSARSVHAPGASANTWHALKSLIRPPSADEPLYSPRDQELLFSEESNGDEVETASTDSGRHQLKWTAIVDNSSDFSNFDQAEIPVTKTPTGTHLSKFKPTTNGGDEQIASIASNISADSTRVVRESMTRIPAMEKILRGEVPQNSDAVLKAIEEPQQEQSAEQRTSSSNNKSLKGLGAKLGERMKIDMTATGTAGTSASAAAGTANTSTPAEAAKPNIGGEVSEGFDPSVLDAIGRKPAVTDVPIVKSPFSGPTIKPSQPVSVEKQSQALNAKIADALSGKNADTPTQKSRPIFSASVKPEDIQLLGASDSAPAVDEANVVDVRVVADKAAAAARANAQAPALIGLSEPPKNARRSGTSLPPASADGMPRKTGNKLEPAKVEAPKLASKASRPIKSSFLSRNSLLLSAAAIVLALISATILFATRGGNASASQLTKAENLLKQNQTDQAIEQLNRIIAANGNDAAAHLLRARAYDQKGELRKALDDYKFVVHQQSALMTPPDAARVAQQEKTSH